MCFSANASFGAGIILGAIGVVAMKKANSSPQRLFAAIPLLFSIQQFSEGFLWLALTNSAYASWQQILTHTFLVFAYVVWPIWIPLTIMLLEKNRKLKKILSILLITGTFISLYIAYCLLLYPVHVSLTDHHVHYNFDYPNVLLGLT